MRVWGLVRPYHRFLAGLCDAVRALATSLGSWRTAGRCRFPICLRPEISTNVQVIIIYSWSRLIATEDGTLIGLARFRDGLGGVFRKGASVRGRISTWSAVDDFRWFFLYVPLFGSLVAGSRPDSAMELLPERFSWTRARTPTAPWTAYTP